MAWRSVSVAVEMVFVLLHLGMDAKNEEGGWDAEPWSRAVLNEGVAEEQAQECIIAMNSQPRENRNKAQRCDATCARHSISRTETPPAHGLPPSSSPIFFPQQNYTSRGLMISSGLTHGLDLWKAGTVDYLAGYNHSWLS